MVKSLHGSYKDGEVPKGVRTATRMVKSLKVLG